MIEAKLVVCSIVEKEATQIHPFVPPRLCTVLNGLVYVNKMCFGMHSCVRKHSDV